MEQRLSKQLKLSHEGEKAVVDPVATWYIDQILSSLKSGNQDSAFSRSMDPVPEYLAEAARYFAESRKAKTDGASHFYIEQILPRQRLMMCNHNAIFGNTIINIKPIT